MSQIYEPLYGASAGSLVPVVVIGPVIVPNGKQLLIGDVDVHAQDKTTVTLEISTNGGAGWSNVRTYYLSDKGNLFRGYASGFSPVNAVGNGALIQFRVRIVQAAAAACSVGINYQYRDWTNRNEVPVSLYGEHVGAAGPTVIIPAFVIPEAMRLNLVEVDFYALQETILTIQQSLNAGGAWSDVRKYYLSAAGFLGRPYSLSYPLIALEGDLTNRQMRAVFTQPGTTGAVAVGVNAKAFSVGGEI
jgi:hypothetical protein